MEEGKVMDDGDPDEMGSSPDDGNESIGCKVNASPFPNGNTFDSQEPDMSLPLLGNTENANERVALLGRTEIPDSDAVSDFSSPVKTSSVNHQLTAASPPGLTSSNRGQATASVTLGDQVELGDVEAVVGGSAMVSIGVPNSSPPLVEGFTSSLLIEDKLPTTITSNMPPVRQSDGGGLGNGSDSRADIGMSQDMQHATSCIDNPQVLTSLPELEFVRTDVDSNYLPDMAATRSEEKLTADDIEPSKITSSIGPDYEESNLTTSKLPNIDSQHFDAAWREIMGTQKLPDSDATQDASQASRVNEDTNRPYLLPLIKNDGGVARTENIRTLVPHHVHLDDSPELRNNGFANEGAKFDSQEQIFDGNTSISQDELFVNQLETSKAAESIQMSLADQEESEDVQESTASNATTASELDSPAVTAIMDFDHSSGREAPKILESPTEGGLNGYEGKDVGNDSVTHAKDNSTISNLDPASKQLLPQGNRSDDIVLIDSGANEPSRTNVDATHAIPEATRAIIPAQTEVNQYRLTTGNSAEDEGNVMTIEYQPKDGLLRKEINCSVSPGSEIPKENRNRELDVPFSTPPSPKQLEILDSDEEPMSDDQPSRQEAYKVSNTESPRDVTIATPLFEQVTIAVAALGSDIAKELATQGEDLEMTGQDDGQRIMKYLQDPASTDNLPKIVDKASGELGEPQKGRKRVIPDSDDEDGEEQAVFQSQPNISSVRQRSTEPALATCSEHSQTASSTFPVSQRPPTEVNQIPSSPTKVEAALPSSQNKGAKTPNASFKLPRISKNRDNNSLFSSPAKPESSSTFMSKAGDQAVERSSSNDLVIAELKAMKIASLKARNAALTLEIATKRAKLEEATKTLRKPAAETVKTHIKLLHDYNDIRDVGQGLIGMIADNRGVRIGELYEEFGVDVKD